MADVQLLNGLLAGSFAYDSCYALFAKLMFLQAWCFGMLGLLVSYCQLMLTSHFCR